MNTNEVTILIADDTPVNLKIIQKFLEPKGFNVVCAVDGQDAIDKFVETNPDIILMDVMMPVKDGYDATKEIKSLSGDKWVPLIFLSAKATVEDQVRGIEVGGDDYLTKPVDLSMLNAKLKAMLRIVEMQRKLNETTQKLQILADDAAVEIELARELMEKMGERKEKIKPDIMQVFTEAAEGISGDIVLSYQCKNPSHSYFILADATGHGLSAAISLIPLAQLFYRLTAHNVSVVDIATQINSRLVTILPPDRFVAASIGFIDRDEKTIEVWNGSNPVPRVVDRKGQVLHTFDINSFSLGVVTEDVFLAESQAYSYTQDCELLFFSDGIIDAQNSDSQTFGNAGVTELLMPPLNSHESMFEKVIANLNEFRDHEKRIDDICVLSVSIE